MVNKKIIDSFTSFDSCGIRFTKPINNLIYEQFNYIIELYHSYKNGILPFSGPTSEQPSQIMNIFSLLGVLENEQMEKEYKKHEKQMKVKK